MTLIMFTMYFNLKQEKSDENFQKFGFFVEEYEILSITQ